MNSYEGNLVAIEGIDGSGTTTLVEMLQEEYESDEFIFTKEPSEQFYGQAVRERLSSEYNPTPADFYGFLADRYQHCENVIIPALEEGKTVVTDRYDLSTYAYQAKILDEQLDIIDPIQYIDEMTYHFTVMPDLYIYINVDVDDALSRIEPEDKYEKRENLEEAKRMYDWFAENWENVTEIQSTFREQIFENTRKEIEKL
jgi:dTMP kinase